MFKNGAYIEAGDQSEHEKVFTETFNSSYFKLCLYAYHFVADKAICEDLVQDCFARLWNRRNEIKFTNLLPYLYTSVRNACLNHHKYTEKTVDLEETGSDDHYLSQAIDAEVCQEVTKSLKWLPTRCREIFQSLYVHGKSPAETARELNITESTIRTQKAKGLQILRTKLGRFLGGLFLLP